MHIDSKTYLIFVKIINGIEVTQESITNEEQILVFAWKSTFMNYEVALALIALIQILLWSDLENIVTHLETNWFHLLGNILTW
jgi:hypothetical protein